MENKITLPMNVEESLANAIRRYINHVLVLAIDSVEISKNDSPLYDETIAHRIGLLPLKMDSKFNEKTEIKLTLNAKKEGYVYSGEFTGDIKLVYDKIPITSLNKGQEINLIAVAKMGRGTEHAKFSPGLAYYRNVAEIGIEKDCPIEVVKVCPQKVFEIEGGKVIQKRPESCDLCEECILFLEKQKKDSIKIGSKEKIIFTVESFGQMEPKEIFDKSVENLKKDLTGISKKLK